MAKRKASWIPPVVLTLVGCVLISTVACVDVNKLLSGSQDVVKQQMTRLSELRRMLFPATTAADSIFKSKLELFAIPPGAGEADEKLLSQLQSDSLTPVEVERILKDYEDRGAKMYFHTVEELATMCDLSLDKCSYEAFERIIEIGNKYRVAVPKLYEYREYCIRTKLKEFCRDHAGEVVALLSKEVSKEDKNLVKRLLGPLQEKEIIDDEEIVQAYLALEKDGLSLNDQKDLLRRVKKALFLHYVSNLGKGKSWFSDSMSITPFDTLDKFIERFIYPVSIDIERVLYDRASGRLKLSLKENSVTPEEVEKIMQQYEIKDVKICKDTVEELAEMCIESSDKCSSAAFEHVLTVSDECKQEVPKVFEYRRHCAKKLINYCRNHANEAQVGEDGKDLLPSLIESLQRAGALEKALGAPVDELKASIAEAYSQLRSSRHGSASVSLNEEKDFLDKVKRALFYRNVVVLGGSGDASAKRDEFYTIAETFVGSVSADIEKAFYATASEQLVEQLNKTSTPEEAEKILQEYENKEVQIFDRTVGDYVDMCDESMINCNYYVWKEMINPAKEIKNNLPKLFEYRKCCAYGRVRSYCRKNADKVVKLMLSMLSEAGKNLAMFYANEVSSIMASGKPWYDDSSKEAYGKLEHFASRGGSSVFSPNRFRKRACYRMRDFGKIRSFTDIVANVFEGHEDFPKGDIMKLSRIATDGLMDIGCAKFKIF